MDINKTFIAIGIVCITILGILALAYLVINVVKHLIWYNADCKFRYNQYYQAQKDLDKLEEDILAHQNYDWTKEPEDPITNTAPGSDAHYEAWKAEQLKKNKSRE